MRRPKLVKQFHMIITLPMILSLGGYFSPTAAQAIKTDRDLAGLKGPVRTVKVERGLASENMVLVEQTTFDAGGNLTEHQTYDDKGELARKEVYKYDTNRKLTEKLTYDGKNALTGKVGYTYDSDGRKIEATSYDTGGTKFSRMTYAYDGRGNIAHETKEEIPAIPSFGEVAQYTYNSRGQLIRKASKSSFNHEETIYEYDSEGHLSREQTSDTVGTRRFRFDSDGRVTEESRTFLGKDSLKTYSYESDSKGNWLKQTATETMREETFTTPLPGTARSRARKQVTVIVQRTIAYY